jgi:hypothetical protein
LKKIVAPLIAIIVVAIVAGVVLLQKPAPVTPPSKPETPTTPTLPETPIKISQKDLREEYDDNPIAADEKYKDRNIITIGTISYIEEKEGKVEIGLLGRPFEYTIRGPQIVCVFNDKKEVINLKKDAKIGVMGRNKGIESVGWARIIRFEDCHIVPLEKIKEFKADFEKKTGDLKIQQFGCDLEIKLISPEGMNKSIKTINYLETISEIKNVYKSVAKGSTYEEIAGEWKTTPGEYRLIVVEKIDSGKEQILYEQRFEIKGMEKAKIEILNISGWWLQNPLTGGYEYTLYSLTLKFSNPEEVPVLVQLPPAVEIYKGEELIAKLRPENLYPAEWGFKSETILLPNEETIPILFTGKGFPAVILTTNVKGGEEYQLTVRIYSEYSPFTGEKKELQEMTINFKVPPYTP